MGGCCPGCGVPLDALCTCSSSNLADELLFFDCKEAGHAEGVIMVRYKDQEEKVAHHTGSCLCGLKEYTVP